MAIATAITAAIITGAVAGGTTIYATQQARRENERNRRAGNEAIDEQVEFERERLAAEERRADLEEAERRRQWEAEQQRADEEFEESLYRWNYDNALESPFRQGSLSAFNQLLTRANLPNVSGYELPAPPAHFSARPGPAEGTRTLLGTPDSNTTQMWDTPTLPTRREEEAMSPASYARLASSPEALSEMTPTEYDEFSRELETMPMSALLAVPPRRQAARRI
jgi:hypothetical protein